MSFSLDLSRAIKNIKEDAEKKVSGTLFSLSSRIIKSTPVGNPALWQNPPPPGYVGGSLRGAWQASIGSPDLSKNNRVDSNGGPTISEVSQVTSAFKIGQSFYLTNPLPYAYRVEYGWSTQAPAGMVRTNVMKAQAVLDKKK